MAKERITQWFVKSIGRDSGNVDQYLMDGLNALGMDYSLQLFELEDGTELQLRWVNPNILNKLVGSDFKFGRDYLIYKRDKNYGPVVPDEIVYGKRKKYSVLANKMKDKANDLKAKKRGG